MSQHTQMAILPLDPSVHDRAGFDCGVEALNRYLREQAGQDIRRHAAGCWVLAEACDPTRVLGFYTLSPESVEAAQIPELSPSQRKRLPRYERLGAALLGRLAVSTAVHGQGLGTQLLYDAMHRALTAEIPSVLIVADPKDEKAETFYTGHGFHPLDASRMFILMTDVAELFRTRDSHR